MLSFLPPFDAQEGEPLHPHTLPLHKLSVPNHASRSLWASLSKEMLPDLPNFGLSPWLLSARFAPS